MQLHWDSTRSSGWPLSRCHECLRLSLSSFAVLCTVFSPSVQQQLIRRCIQYRVVQYRSHSRWLRSTIQRKKGSTTAIGKSLHIYSAIFFRNESLAYRRCEHAPMTGACSAVSIGWERIKKFYDSGFGFGLCHSFTTQHLHTGWF